MLLMEVKLLRYSHRDAEKRRVFFVLLLIANFAPLREIQIQSLKLKA